MRQNTGTGWFYKYIQIDPSTASDERRVLIVSCQNQIKVER